MTGKIISAGQLPTVGLYLKVFEQPEQFCDSLLSFKFRQAMAELSQYVQFQAVGCFNSRITIIDQNNKLLSLILRSKPPSHLHFLSWCTIESAKMDQFFEENQLKPALQGVHLMYFTEYLVCQVLLEFLSTESQNSLYWKGP